MILAFSPATTEAARCYTTCFVCSAEPRYHGPCGSEPPCLNPCSYCHSLRLGPPTPQEGEGEQGEGHRPTGPGPPAAVTGTVRVVRRSPGGGGAGSVPTRPASRRLNVTGPDKPPCSSLVADSFIPGTADRTGAQACFIHPCLFTRSALSVF